MELYVKSELTLEALAAKVIREALPAYTGEIREDQDVGGGRYYALNFDKNEIILIHNHSGHARYFVEAMKQFSYYFYVRSGPEELLPDMQDSLSAAGFSCELADHGNWTESAQQSGWRIKQ
jgi:hypothetical protein